MPIYGVAQWPEPGVWAEPIEDVIVCKSGYHASVVDNLVGWCGGPELWEVEYNGPVQVSINKVVGSQARLVRRVEEWNAQTAHLFAADCAEHVLHLFEAKRPDDDRPRHAVETARLYATGKATLAQLAAARYAAWDAARDTAIGWLAAWDAARSAYWSAQRSVAAEAVTHYAAMAAGGIEQVWQTERLIHYTGIER